MFGNSYVNLLNPITVKRVVLIVTMYSVIRPFRLSYEFVGNIFISLPCYIKLLNGGLFSIHKTKRLGLSNE